MTELEKQVASILEDYRVNSQTKEECAKEIITLVQVTFLAHPDLMNSVADIAPSKEP